MAVNPSAAKKQTRRRGGQKGKRARAAAPVAEPAAKPTSPPVSTEAFAGLGLLPEIVRAIGEAGYSTPTPIQTDAIPVALRGRDVMGLAQTGTGKTFAFTVPIIQRLAGGPRRLRSLIL